MNFKFPRNLKWAAILLQVLTWPALAQTLYLYPTQAIAPRGSYQTVTAVVAGVNNKTVTWSTNHGTLVGTNPCVENAPCTIAVYDTTARVDTLTATTNVGAIVATSSLTFTASPTVATGHPRLYLTAAMLPGLQAKATAGNTIYQANLNYTTTYTYNFLSAAPYSWNWTTWNGSACATGTGLPAANYYDTTILADANAMAYLANIAPTSTLRNQWGCRARDAWVYAMNAVLGGNINLIGNGWSDNSTIISETADWLDSGYLSSADQTLTRQFLAFMAKNLLNGTFDNNGVVPPLNVGYNNSSLFNIPLLSGTDPVGTQRGMGNNYTFSRMLILAGAALTFDDNTTDDPPLTNTCSATRYQVCPDGTAGSLHAYWTYLDGAMMYNEWAHIEDPVIAWSAYQTAYANLPSQPTCKYTNGVDTPCFGDGRDGESSEGSWYGYSLMRLRQMLNILYTAGYNDPILYGPQISLGTSSFWDTKYVADLEFITGFNQNNGGFGGTQPSYSYLTTGNSNTYYRTPSDYIAESAMMVFDTYTGRTDRMSALEWPILNTAFGGPLGTMGTCSGAVGGCGFDNSMMGVYGNGTTQDLFIALPAADPTVSLPADPRPSLPLDIYNPSFNQHQMVRDSWTSPTLFSYYCDNAQIDHEYQWCGKFEIFSKGDYITKGRTAFTDNYDHNYMVIAQSSNELFLANQLTNGSDICTEPYCPSAGGGGQFSGAQSTLIPSGLLHSELPAYAADIVDNTGFYNGFWAYDSPYDIPTYDDVTAASRSLIYLRGTNQVAFYDRGTTGHAGAKGVYQTITGTPTISGSTASWLTRSSTQKAYLTTLLPAGATLTNDGLPCTGCSGNQANDWEPSAQLQISASGTPTSAQFLTVLSWGNSSYVQPTVALIQSTAGQTFDCAEFGDGIGPMTCFIRAPASFTGTTYPASGATTHYVADLTPNTSYAITGAGTPGSATTDTAGVLTFSAAGTGNITIGTGGTPTVATPTFSPVAGTYGPTQTVTISTSTGGASLVYTADGSTPTVTALTCTITHGTLVSGPVTVSTSQTLKAIGCLSGDNASAVGTAIYVINGAAATPTFSPVAGPYTGTQSVTLSTATSGCGSFLVWNTTNAQSGGNLTGTSSTNPLSVSTSETVYAQVQSCPTYLNSAIGSAAYTINPASGPTTTAIGTVTLVGGPTIP